MQWSSPLTLCDSELSLVRKLCLQSMPDQNPDPMAGAAACAGRPVSGPPACAACARGPQRAA